MKIRLTVQDNNREIMSAPPPPSYNDVYEKKQPDNFGQPSAPPSTGYMPVGSGYGHQPPPAGYPNNYSGAPYPAGAPYGQPQPVPLVEPG